jgi:prepilin-type N-terminal cleavage/methylation domain-containing protein/prepilin-type processing-associated H-X9-DG protein
MNAARQSRSSAFTLLEILVVIAVVAVLLALLIPAVLKALALSQRAQCQNKLHQLGIALNNYHNTEGCFPPGLISTDSNVCNADTTGFTLLLPYLERDTTRQIYHSDQPWFHPSNYQAVATEVPMFYCPANRARGQTDLRMIGKQWGFDLPPVAATCDYAFCKGANAALNRDWTRIPLEVRGVFNVRPPEEPVSGVRHIDIVDGESSTLAMGDAAGGSKRYLVRDLSNPGYPVFNSFIGSTVPIEQSWSAAGVTDPNHPYYGSVFAVTAQYGLLPDPRDEPMNRTQVTPTVCSGDPRGDNHLGHDTVSGFRSQHHGGCNFLLCDGSVHFILETINADVYRALSTYAGGEVIIAQW